MIEMYYLTQLGCRAGLSVVQVTHAVQVEHDASLLVQTHMRS